MAAAIVASASVLHEQHTERKVVEVRRKFINECRPMLYCGSWSVEKWLAKGWTIEREIKPDPDTSFLVFARKKTPRPRPTGGV